MPLCVSSSISQNLVLRQQASNSRELTRMHMPETRHGRIAAQETRESSFVIILSEVLFKILGPSLIKKIITLLRKGIKEPFEFRNHNYS